MVNHVTSPESLMLDALECASRIARNAPIAVRQAKQAITIGSEIGLRAGLAFEIEAYNRTVPTADRREGVAAFNEKRRPEFQGH
jgi:enoyl-CoA hydratase/carnithine racemase